MASFSRRKFLSFAGGTIGVLALAACGGTSTPTTGSTGGTGSTGSSTAPSASGAATARATQSSGPAPQAGQKKVTFWSAFGGKNGEALTKLVNDFNGSQQTVFIDNQFQGNYDETAQKLAASIAARQVPDMVVLSEVTWNRFSLNKTLQELLDDLLTTGGVDPKDYVDSLIAEGTRQGKIWWVPFARSTPLFYYNRTLFKEAGLEDRAPKTWDEVRTFGLAIQKLNKPDLKAYAFTNAKNFNAWHFQGNVWQWGG